MSINSYDNPHGYDAVLVVSFGGPEGMDDVMPFLENVLRGKNVPRERMIEVSHHYEQFGGISPLNNQNRSLISALTAELTAFGPDLPIYWGNRNWHPMLEDAVRQMRDDGIKKALAFFTSGYSSYSGCRQYRENIAEAQEKVGDGAPEIHLLRKFYNHPGFVEPNAEMIRTTLEQIPAERRAAAQIVFTAHSIPTAMAENCMYETQLLDTSQIIAERIGHPNWELVYQSRSGPPSQPWLEPDILDHLEALKAEGVQDVVVAPIGFISDHMEVMFDLDTEARELSAEFGLNMLRVPSVGVHPRFVRMIRELIIERMTASDERPYLGSRGPSHDVCPVNCCLPGARRPAPAAASSATSA